MPTCSANHAHNGVTLRLVYKVCKYGFLNPCDMGKQCRLRLDAAERDMIRVLTATCSYQKHQLKMDPRVAYYIWAATRENLSSGFPTKRVSNQSPQLQRLARKLKFHL